MGRRPSYLAGCETSGFASPPHDGFAFISLGFGIWIGRGGDEPEKRAAHLDAVLRPVPSLQVLRTIHVWRTLPRLFWGIRPNARNEDASDPSCQLRPSHDATWRPAARGRRHRMSLVLQVALGLVLLVGTGLKLAAPRSSQSALGTFGVRGRRTGWAIWGLIVTIEAALGVAVILGSALAAYSAAALLLAFALLQVVTLARGRRGAPCGCFGPRSRLSPVGVARDLALALGLAALPTLPALSTDEWLALGFGVLLLAVTVLAVAVAALAREVGVLRLALGPQAALEIPHEGPEVGSRSEVVERIEHSPGAQLALAVFSSDGCRLCQALQSSVAFVADDPLIALRVFDEHRDADVWQALDVPGAPFAVAMDFDGTVQAKGTFNSLGQLESVLATAGRRRQEAAHAT